MVNMFSGKLEQLPVVKSLIQAPLYRVICYAMVSV